MRVPGSGELEYDLDKNVGMTTNDNLLANVLHKFDWEVPDGGKENSSDMSEQLGITIRKR